MSEQEQEIGRDELYQIIMNKLSVLRDEVMADGIVTELEMMKVLHELGNLPGVNIDATSANVREWIEDIFHEQGALVIGEDNMAEISNKLCDVVYEKDIKEKGMDGIDKQVVQDARSPEEKKKDGLGGP